MSVFIDELICLTLVHSLQYRLADTCAQQQSYVCDKPSGKRQTGRVQTCGDPLLLAAADATSHLVTHKSVCTNL